MSYEEPQTSCNASPDRTAARERTGSPAARTLIDELLAEQQSLTAVERFARTHERHDFPAQERYYRDLLPLAKPDQGEQYAFAVDLDACTGCKACVSACHSLNGLDEEETWRDIGLLHGGSPEEPWQQTVTTACHHCVEPACLEGCPVRAYEKDADTGIVRHLDDQCIGCQYCVLKCPYDVPKYSKKRGIVRKCDMCYGRLSAGEAPACVQACPSAAISIRVVEKSLLVSQTHEGDHLLPGAFDSSYTKPTTVYQTTRGIPENARPGNAGALRIEHAHWPLIWMLVLTQTSVGLLVAACALCFGDAHAFGIVNAPFALTAFILLNLGLAVSVLHLGRPLGAWRAFLGLRTSWMSREILAFSLFAAASAAFTGVAFWKSAADRVPQLHLLEQFIQPSHFIPLLAFVSAGLGLLGVFCSAMIYIDTHRPFWRRNLTFGRFFGATFLLGSAGVAVLLGLSGLPLTARFFAVAAIFFRSALFEWEWSVFKSALRDEIDANHRSALILDERLRPLVNSFILLFLGSIAFGLLSVFGMGRLSASCATAAFFLTLFSQIIERYVFFAAGVAPRMPGVSAPQPHSTP